MPLESSICSTSKKALKKAGAVVIKIHGSAFARAGEPDLIGVLEGKPFAIETKQEGRVS